MLVIVDGDRTYGRRLYTQVARNLEGETLDGQRYEFEVLVETPDSAVSHWSELAEIFDGEPSWLLATAESQARADDQLRDTLAC